MAEEFVLLKGGQSEVKLKRERIRHLLIGSPQLVRRTIQALHVKGYAEANLWTRPVDAGNLGEPGEVISILLRFVSPE